MYDFDTLMNEVLGGRPEITREKLIEMVQEKKRTVGAGFLTDQGALFLIAGELGIQLQRVTSTDLTLKDLYIGAGDITVVARVLAIYPISGFQRKDGTAGRYRRVNLFDRTSVTRLTIWEDNEDAIKLAGVEVDTAVRIASAYVRQGLDGKPNLNLGKRGRIEILSDHSLVSKLASISELSRPLDEVEEDPGSNFFLHAVEGVIASDSRVSTFVRSDGSNGSLTQFSLAGLGESKKIVRVVVWDASITNASEVKKGQKVRVTNLRYKRGRQGEPELHGDSGSILQLLGNESPSNQKLPNLKFTKVSEARKVTEGLLNLEVMALSRGSVREVHLRDGSTVRKGEVVIGDDTGEITVVAWRESAEMVSRLDVGEKLQILGATIQVSKMGIEMLQLNTSSRIEKIFPTR